MKRYEDDDISSSDSDSSSDADLSASTNNDANGNNNSVHNQYNRKDSRSSGFGSMLGDYMGDTRASLYATGYKGKPTTQETKQDVTTPTMKSKKKKKKLVPQSSAKKIVPSSTSHNSNSSNQKCYLINGTDTQGSLIEYYSEEHCNEFLAYWTAPPDKQIPKFKFTQNWGKSELINSTQGDLRGKRAYFSGICQVSFIFVLLLYMRMNSLIQSF